MNSDYSITNIRYDKKIHSTHKADNSTKDKSKEKEEGKDADNNRDNFFKEDKNSENKKDNDKGISVDFRA